MTAVGPPDCPMTALPLIMVWPLAWCLECGICCVWGLTGWTDFRIGRWGWAGAVIGGAGGGLVCVGRGVLGAASLLS